MRVVVLCLIGFVALVSLLLIVFDRPAYQEIDLTVESQRDQLNARLIRPKGDAPLKGCVIFIHGDGALDYTAYGYYKPFWTRLARQSYCAVSWDKPGVGQSEGQWLQDSMTNRAARVGDVITALINETGLEPQNIHLLSFSQGGWVAPKVLQDQPCLASWISVSGAINWQDQGQYMGRVRREQAGMAAAQIEAELAENDALNARMAAGMSYQEMLNDREAQGLSLEDAPREDQWNFWVRNINTDVRADLDGLKPPVLALFGDHDAYVDVVESQAVYGHALEGREAPYRARVFVNANHGLMKSKTLKSYHSEWAGLWTLIKLEVLGEQAFASDVFEEIESWLNKVQVQHRSVRCSM